MAPKRRFTTRIDALSAAIPDPANDDGPTLAELLDQRTDSDARSVIGSWVDTLYSADCSDLDREPRREGPDVRRPCLSTARTAKGAPTRRYVHGCARLRSHADGSVRSALDALHKSS